MESLLDLYVKGLPITEVLYQHTVKRYELISSSTVS